MIPPQIIASEFIDQEPSHIGDRVIRHIPGRAVALDIRLGKLTFRYDAWESRRLIAEP